MEKNKSNNNKLLDIKDLLFIWKLITGNLLILILIPFLAYAFGYIYTYRLNNIYGAKVQLLLKSDDTYDYQDPIYDGLGAYGVYMDVQNQMRIIKSKDLIGEVIDRLKINTSYYVVGRLTKKEVFETLPFRANAVVLNPSLFEIPIEVEILNSNQYEISYILDGETYNIIHEFDKEFENSHCILTVSKQYTYDEATLKIIMASDYEIVFHDRDYLISKYQNSLEIENLEHTSVLDVYISDELQQRAKVFLDTLTAVYIENSKDIQLEVNQNTLENIEKQIDTIDSFIKEKEYELLNYKDQNAVLNLDKQEDEFFKQYVFYTNLRRELEQKKNSVISLDGYLKESQDDRLLPPYFLIEQSDSYLNDAIPKIRSKQINLEVKRSQEYEESPNIINLKKEIALLKKDVRSYLVNLLVAIETEIKVIEGHVKEYESDIKSLPKSAQDILNIQRELDVNNKMYLFLLEKKTNTLITRAGIIPQVSVIETPPLMGVVEPDKKKLIRLFVLAGFVIALVIAALRKLIFERVENVQGLSEITSMNIVGGIPKTKIENSTIVIETKPKSNVTESFRTLRTNLSFMGTQNDKAKKVIVSSFFPGEGKTYCSTNLAAILARADKKTLIIDFDLHRPKVHKSFGVENSSGMTNYLIGKAEFEDIVQRNVLTNLDIITCGILAPNPSELILRTKVKELFDIAELKYDYIIVDTPTVWTIK
ncbi:MAG: polysaccharide biosynthesis tyrosine autokinase [Crocinitomicaceae bacterium]|nr:polysaccharide biosynthesis tyrosine autokinase [Crocinitomicaceae bacterium]